MPTPLRLAVPLALLVLAGCTQESVAPVKTRPATDAKPTKTTEPNIPRTPSPEGARVYFVTPSDGATVSSPVTIEFGIEGMTVVTAGTQQEASGHHHLLVDAALPPFNAPIPATDNYIHFGDGSTSTTLDLEPGEHTLQLLLGDHFHIPHEPPVASEVILITVE